MDTSDDFIAALFGGGGSKDKVPTREAENPTKTAKRVDEGSEAARRSRQRRRAATSFRDEPPKLGTPGLFRTVV